MDYFKDCKTIENIKSTYRTLSKLYHPDLNAGNDTAFKELNNQYETAIKNYSYEHFTEFTDSYMIILSKIIKLDITIEIIGTWIYAFNSYEHKDYLKTLGFWFSSKHKAWVYTGKPKRNKYSKYTLLDIENKHGYKKIKTRKDYRIA